MKKEENGVLNFNKYSENKKIEDFLNKYSSLYPKYLEDDFKKIYDGYTKNNDIINQIYCYLNIVDIKKTDYYIFYEYLKKNNFLTDNLLEVCCGAIPILSDIIFKNNYKVTAIDKKIVIKEYEFEIIEKKVDSDFKFQKYNMVVAFRPCLITELIIKKCLTNKIPFCIYLCNCELYPQENYELFNKDNWSNEKWINYLKYIIKKYNINNMDIKIDYNTNLFDQLPIISAK